MKKDTQKGISNGKKIAIGASIVAVGAGAYYLLGPKGKEHQKKAGAILTKIKKEVVRETKKAKEMSVPLYHKAVDAISDKYSKEYNAHEKEIRALAAKIKGKVKEVKAKVRAKTSKAK